MFRAIIDGKVLMTPDLVFTRRGNPAAEKVLEQVQAWNQSDGQWSVQTRVFDTDADIQACLGNGQDPSRAVVLWDQRGLGKRFTFAAPGRTSGASMPSFAHGAQWGVVINSETAEHEGHARNCAEQISADFGRRFDERVYNPNGRHFPWGKPKANETLPDRPMLSKEMDTILTNLNDGPDMAAEVNEAVRGKLPEGQNFSWLRVPDRPAYYPRDRMEARLSAVEALERTSTELIAAHPEVADKLMLGVTLDPGHPELQECYLRPMTAPGEQLMQWSVRRPDMHVCGDDLVASENDEMPGGFTDCFHVDRAYGINGPQWEWCLNWLCSEGPLLFVVSDDWSRPYIPSMTWMTEQMVQMGHEAHIITTSELDRLTVNEAGVFLQGEDGRIKIGTIWRQFPVFETRGTLAELVVAANEGRVRMVPEFAHFGNKSWFALYREYRSFFLKQLGRETIELLDMLIPNTRLVVPGTTINATLAGKRIATWSDLVNLGEEHRHQLVLKITGANDKAARSYGVFMGQAQNQAAWKEWLEARRAAGEAFIVQERFETSLERIAVYNTAKRQAEPFACRVLLRPWVVGGRLVTSHSACTPHYTTIVHGMLPMAVQPMVWT